MTHQDKSHKIVIIGGGISGLAAAHRLLEERLRNRLSLEIVLLEAKDRLGGIIATERSNDLILESGPDSIFTQKPWAMNLISRLDLDGHVISTNEKDRRTLVAHRRKLYPLPEGFILLAPTKFFPFLCSPLFSWKGKLRIALDLVLPAGKAVADESLSDFVCRRLGSEALDRIAQPMIGGIYTANPQTLSMRATMPQFLDMESQGSGVIRGLIHSQRQTDAGARYNLFASLDQGLQLLIDRLAQRLSAVDIKLNSQVTRLSYDQERRGWIVRLSDDSTITTDAVIVSTPAPFAAAMLKDVDPKLSSDIMSIDCASSAVVNLIYNRSDIRHPLNGFGFVVPLIENRAILAATFSSIKFPGRAPKGQVLIRAFVGGAVQKEVYARSDSEIAAAAREDLELYLGIDRPPLGTYMARHPCSMPQYRIGHLDLVSGIESKAARHRGLALSGNAYRGVGISDCIHSGETAAESILSQFSSSVSHGDTT